MTTKRILASTVQEAIDKARQIFAQNPDTEFVIANGAATVGGATYFGDHTLLMHRSERAIWTLDPETDKQKLRP